MNSLLTGNAWLISSLVVLGLGLWWLLPQRLQRPRIIGYVLVLIAGVMQGLRLNPSMRPPVIEELLFWIFGGGGLFCAILMVTSHNPVYSALWFALVTLCTCGLFLMQGAPFLAAATIIVYAGAIIVVFMFVIMLAQQGGATAYDQRSRRPLLGTVAAVLLMAALLTTLARARPALATSQPQTAETETAPLAIPSSETAAAAAPIVNPLSHPQPGEPEVSMKGLGRSLFGDYLFAVELAGTLLLIASIGAIAIAPRREQGTL
jgi:NADH-quinone oxidoreductase subunit J